jgi:hypothetical protein
MEGANAPVFGCGCCEAGNGNNPFLKNMPKWQFALTF